MWILPQLRRRTRPTKRQQHQKSMQLPPTQRPQHSSLRRSRSKTKLPQSLQMTGQVHVEGHTGKQLKARATTGLWVLCVSHHSMFGPTPQDSSTGSHLRCARHSDWNHQVCATFSMSPVNTNSKAFQVMAAIVPKASADLPLQRITEAITWDFL